MTKKSCKFELQDLFCFVVELLLCHFFLYAYVAVIVSGAFQIDT